MLEQVLIAVAFSRSSAQAPSLRQPAEPSARCSVAPDADDVRDAVPPDAWIISLRTAATMDVEALRGRRIAVRDARVERLDGRGFWIATSVENCPILVVPAEGPLIQVRPGELIDLQGEFRRQIGTTGGREHETMYVYAYIVRNAPPDVP